VRLPQRPRGWGCLCHTLSPNTEYTLTGWGKAVSGSACYLNIAADGFDPGVQFTSSSWAQKSTTFTTPASFDWATVQMNVESSSTCRYDDIVVEETSAPPPPPGGGNIILNPFVAKADAARTMRVELQEDASPWTTYWFEEVNLTASGQTFGPFTFDCTTDDPAAALRFYVGGNTTNVYVDSVVVDDGNGPTPQPTSTPGAGSGNWSLVWNDEFNGSSVDTSKWNVLDCPNGINNDIAYMTPSNVYVQNGNLLPE